KVTMDELKTVMPDLTDERFKKMDHNGDGALTPDDRPEGGPGKPGAGNPGMLRELFQKADANADKQLTFDEIVAVRPAFKKEVFDRMDHNHDGVVSKDDRPAGGPGAGQRDPAQMREAMRQRMLQADADKNGQITREELKTGCPNMPPEAFDRMDHNGDGVLSELDKRTRNAKPQAQPQPETAAAPAPEAAATPQPEAEPKTE
ncbi:MAG: hypothetical protein QG656_533, partial [Candidatus Hydrogenedentes bacterium]|nr:hypothetical protein [Candidatus Hydrogenedentota bacterium]